MDGVGDKNYTRYSGLIQYIHHPPTPYGTKGCYFYVFAFSTAIQKQPCGILGPVTGGYFHHNMDYN